jgi:hypothetical protein
MAMEIQMMRRAGYAMKIKTPAEAAGHPIGHKSESRAGFWSVWRLDFTGGPNSAQKNLSFNPAFAQIWVEIASV